MSENNLEPRVSVLEHSVSTLTDDVRLLHHTVKQQGVQLTKGFADLSDKMRESNKPNWGNIIAAIGLVIVLVGAILAPVWMSFSNVNKRIDNNYSDIGTIYDGRLKNEYHRGVLETQIAAVKQEIKNVEDRLVKHMRSGNNHPEGVISCF